MRSIALKILTTIVLGTLALRCGTGMAQENLQTRAASSLSEQFETVLYSKPQFVSSWDMNNPLPKDPASNLRYPFAYLWLALDSLSTTAASELLANGDAVLMGAKDFRSPHGLGGVRSQRCYVVVLKSGNSFDLQNYTHNSAMTSAFGLLIWNWSAKLGEFGEGTPDKFEFRDQPSALYATKIEQSYLLVSNEVKELEALAKRLASSSRTSQSSVGFHNWGELLQHEMCGYRRYRHSETNDPMAAGTEDVPLAAEYLAFFLDATKGSLVLRLSLKDPTSESAVAKLYSKNRLPTPKHSGATTWEAAIPLSGDRASFDRSFFTMVSFGFGVYT